MMAFDLMRLFKQVLLKQTIRKKGGDQPIQHTLVNAATSTLCTARLHHPRGPPPATQTGHCGANIQKNSPLMVESQWATVPASIKPGRFTPLKCVRTEIRPRR